MLKKLVIIKLFLLFSLFFAVARAQESTDTGTPEQLISEPVQNEYLHLDTTFNLKFNEIFSEFVDPEGMVDYKDLRRKRSYLAALSRELASLRVEDHLTWDDSEQVAFWVNVHNFCLLKLVTENYPIEPSRLKLIFYPSNSIMHIKNARTDHFFNIMGREYNLNELEENVSKLYTDPRIFFTLSQGSMSSAILRNEPYLGHKLEEQIDDQVRKFLSRELSYYIDRSEDTIYLSDLFKRYKDSFIEHYQTEERYRTRPEDIRAYFNFINQQIPSNGRSILSRDDYLVKFIRHDWKLNDSSAK